MDEKDLQNEMRDIKKTLQKMLSALSTLTGKVDVLDGRVITNTKTIEKLQKNYEKSNIQDAILNTSFAEHTKQDDNRFESLEKQVDNRFQSLEKKIDRAINTGEENKSYIQRLEGSMKVYGFIAVFFQTVAIGVLMWYLNS